MWINILLLFKDLQTLRSYNWTYCRRIHFYTVWYIVHIHDYILKYYYLRLYPCLNEKFNTKRNRWNKKKCNVNISKLNNRDSVLKFNSLLTTHSNKKKTLNLHTIQYNAQRKPKIHIKDNYRKSFFTIKTSRHNLKWYPILTRTSNWM